MNNFEVRHPRCVGSITNNFSCITNTVEHNYISSSSTVGIQLHVSALYVGHEDAPGDGRMYPKYVELRIHR